MFYVFSQLRATLNIVLELRENSGWTWSDIHGSGINIRTQSTWDDYVRQHPGAAPFRNKGWEHWDDMADIMPAKLCGKHVVRPLQQLAQSQEEDEIPSTANQVNGLTDRAYSPDWDLSGFSQDDELEDGAPLNSQETRDSLAVSFLKCFYMKIHL